MRAEENPKTVLIVGIIATIVTLIAVGSLLVVTFTGDKWESDNRAAVIKSIGEADQLASSDKLKAFRIYEKVLEEAAGHEIESTYLNERLKHAEEIKSQLWPAVEGEIRRQEAEEKRLAEEKRRTEEELARLAKERERARQLAEEEEAKRVDEEQRRLETVRKQARKYEEASSAARNALNALKRVEARTEVGINYSQYSDVLGEAWAEVKIFIESPEGKKLWELSAELEQGVSEYKTALSAWGKKIESKYGALYEFDIQLSWRKGSQHVERAEALLNPERCRSELLKLYERLDNQSSEN